MDKQQRTEDLVHFVRTAHEGQTDKCGFDYFETRLLPVARSVPADLFFVALAHDILEDTNTTVSDLREAGFSEFDIQLVKLLTKKKGNDYGDYLDQIAANPHAKIVKVMDIVNNLSRIGCIKKKETYTRLVKKYIEALSHLKF